MELFILLGVLCVVAVNAIAPRIKISAPLLLVVIGVVVSVQPLVSPPVVEVDAELVLAGVLPLLLFAAARSMPATNFRRNLSSITGLSITLVVISTLALGAMFSAMLPGLGLAGGIAMGAILSPTDAVATSIVKKLGVAPRVVALLDGEAMLNDASALVLLRAAIAAMATSVSISSVAGTFALSVLVATSIGITVGHLTLRIRRRISEPTVNTLLSFAVPFIAYQPMPSTTRRGRSGPAMVCCSCGPACVARSRSRPHRRCRRRCRTGRCSCSWRSSSPPARCSSRAARSRG